MIKNWKKVALKDLVEAPWNYKTDDESIDLKLEENIKRNGVVQNLIVRDLEDGRYEVVNGNHRFRVLQKLNTKEVMAYHLGNVPLEYAKRVALETNETSYKNDQTKLAELLVDLEKSFGTEDLLVSVPFELTDLEGMKKMLEFDFDSLESDRSKLNSGLPQSGSDEDWREFKVRLPEGVCDQLEAQILRFKQALHPDEEHYEDVSPVQAIEALVQHIAQIPDDQLI